MTKYADLAALNDVKLFIMNLSGERLRNEAQVSYGIYVEDYDSELEVKMAMIAKEERNYFK